MVQKQPKLDSSSWLVATQLGLSRKFLMQLKVKQICTTLAFALGLIAILMILLMPNLQRAHATAGSVYCVVPPGELLGPFAPCDQVFSSIQQAVDMAIDGEEVWIAGGTYTEMSQRMGITQAVYISRSLTLRGGYALPFTAVPDPIAHPTTLDAQHQGRVVNIAVTGTLVTLENLRLTGGGSFNIQASRDGGGIFNQGSLILNSVIISDNGVQLGGGAGGIFNMGVLTMTNAAVSNNSTGAHFGSGGGIHNQGWLTIINSTIDGNSVFEASGGGGIFNSGTLMIRNATITNNSNGGFFGPGGGIANAGVLSLTNTTISHNYAASPGGAIDNQSGASLSITDATIANNMAAFGAMALS